MARKIQYIARYRLPKWKLESYLQALFPSQVIYVDETDEDIYKVVLPRLLIDSERDDIMKLNRSSWDFQDYSQGEQSKKEEDVEFPLHETGIPIIVPVQKLTGDSTVPEYLKFDIEMEDYIKETGQVVHGIYSTQIDLGSSARVFATTSALILGQQDQGSNRYSQNTRPVIKVAVKRLGEGTHYRQFKKEYDNLKKINRNSTHNNLVQMLSAFRLEYNDTQYFNFAFPLAIGNLKHLFRGNLEESAIDWLTLWAQFEPLADAVKFLHYTIGVAHQDIKPSNILIYQETSQQPPSLKLTDFGISINLQDVSVRELGTIESRTAWAYDAPEARAKFKENIVQSSGITYAVSNARELIANDIWKLGCVFLELESFLVRGGPSGVREFRDFITTIKKTAAGDIPLESIHEENRLDDGRKVKAQVLNWIKILQSQDDRASRLGDIIYRMLSQEKDRPDSAEVHRLILEAKIVDPDSYYDGFRIVTLEGYNPNARYSLYDKSRTLVEQFLGQKVDWRPLSPIHYLPAKGSMRVSWKYGKSTLMTILETPAEVEAYLKTCIPLHQQPRTRNSTTASAVQSTTAGSTSTEMATISSTISGREVENTTTGAAQGGLPGSTQYNGTNLQGGNGQTRDVYLCIDCPWTQPLESKMIRLGPLETICQDDASFYRRCRLELRSARGGLVRDFLSWKSCMYLEFRKFYIVRDTATDIDIGHAQVKPPWQGYETNMGKPYDVHMRLAAISFVKGIRDPDAHRGQRLMLSIIPKKLVPPSVELKYSSEGVGIRPIYNVSFWKFLVYLGVMMFLTLVFAALWLILVDKTDLQNAFVPVTIVVGFISVWVAVAQYIA